MIGPSVGALYITASTLPSCMLLSLSFLPGQGLHKYHEKDVVLTLKIVAH